MSPGRRRQRRQGCDQRVGQPDPRRI